MPRRSSRRPRRQNVNRKCEGKNWIIPAGLLMGLGVGIMTGQIPGFLLIGLGLGFLFSYFMCKK